MNTLYFCNLQIIYCNTLTLPQRGMLSGDNSSMVSSNLRLSLPTLLELGLYATLTRLKMSLVEMTRMFRNNLRRARPRGKKGNDVTST